MNTLFSRFVTFAAVVLSGSISGCSSSNILADIYRTTALWSKAGASLNGEPVYFYKRGSVDSVALILGCTHGDEQVTGKIVARLAEVFSTQPEDSLRYTLLFVPVLNPDGLKQGTRTNARGIDINRNMPTKNWSSVAAKKRYAPGDAPGSEPETQVLLTLLSQYQPRLIISIHEPLHLINYDGPAFEIANRMAQWNHYVVSDTIGYPTPGSLGTYAGVERGIPTITLELPPVGVDEAWEQNTDALLHVLSRR